MSGIFLSHSSGDNAVAAEVKEWLLEQGHRSVCLDFDPESGIPAGRSWEQELYQQLRMTLMHGLRAAVLAGVMLVAAASVQASPLFDSSEVLELTIEGPFAGLLDAEQSRELPFVLSTGHESHTVGIRKRGKSRLRVCQFPPLRVNFDKNETSGTFGGQNKLKLVTHCKDTDAYAGYLLKEYAVYRMFNVISDRSYRVRLARVRYVDSSGELVAQRPAFFVESARQLGARLEAVPVSRPHLTLAQLVEQQAAAMFVFQYMIANTDWSLVTADEDDACCHNVDLLEHDERLLVVPYDFDLAGLVNAAHARPDPALGITRVTTRRYRGYCLPAGAVDAALRDIQGKEQEILAVLTDIPGIADKTAESAAKFLGRFFQRARDDKRLIARFESRCL